MSTFHKVPAKFDHIGRFVDFCRGLCTIDKTTTVIASVITPDGQKIHGILALNHNIVELKDGVPVPFQLVGCVKTDTKDCQGETLYWFYPLRAVEDEIFNDFNVADRRAAWAKYKGRFNY